MKLATGRRTAATAGARERLDAGGRDVLDVVDGRGAERGRELGAADVGELPDVQPDAEACGSRGLADDARLVDRERVRVDVGVDEAREPVARDLGHELARDARDVRRAVGAGRERVQREERRDDRRHVLARARRARWRASCLRSSAGSSP